jgi:hypothetical protein
MEYDTHLVVPPHRSRGQDVHSGLCRSVEFRRASFRLDNVDCAYCIAVVANAAVACGSSWAPIDDRVRHDAPNLVAAADRIVAAIDRLTAAVKEATAPTRRVVPPPVGSDGGEALLVNCGKSVDELTIGVRAINCLRHAGIKKIGDLAGLTAIDILRMPHAGSKTVKDINDALAEIGMGLRPIK